MSKRGNPDEPSSGEGPSNPKRMEIREPEIPNIQIVVRKELTDEEKIQKLLKIMTITGKTVRKNIHNFSRFGNRTRKTGTSWARVPWGIDGMDRIAWFGANRMSRMEKDPWRVEVEYPSEWYHRFYHVVENEFPVHREETEEESTEPGSSGLTGPNSICLNRHRSSEDAENGEQCMECMKIASSSLPIRMETISPNHYILVYLAVGVYRAKWTLDAAKVVYATKVACTRGDLSFSLLLCREHLRDTKLLMEFSYLVWRYSRTTCLGERRPIPVILRVFTIAQILQQFANCPSNMRLNMEAFVEICYEQFLQAVLREKFPNEEVEAFVNALP